MTISIRMLPVTCLPIACLLMLSRAASGGGLAVEPDEQNVVASRLEGTWQAHAELTQRLKGRARGGGEIAFRSDATVAGKIPEKYAGIFEERKMRIYLAGYVKLGPREEVPFVLTQIHGNPHVLFWLPRDGDPFGNGESFNIILAPAEDKQNDLLFTGGDFNNEAFRAYERKKTEQE